METKSPFLDTIFLLRKEECITLFSNLQQISPQEEAEAGDYFEAEFEKVVRELKELNIQKSLLHSEVAMLRSKTISPDELVVKLTQAEQ